MGCKDSKIDTKFNDTIVINHESQEGIRAVQETWLSIKKIENLGPKTAAHLMRSYPAMKKLMNISSSLKTETELLRLNEVRELGNMLLAVYNDLIKHAEINLDEKIRSKATVLAKQTLDPQLIKVIAFLDGMHTAVSCILVFRIELLLYGNASDGYKIDTSREGLMGVFHRICFESIDK